MIPRLLLAAPASGAGKTTVATGLMAALAARGLAVSGHKVGPDYIDPTYHALATGRPPRNLDPFLVGEERIAPLLAHGAAGADVAVIEGALGLFDGRGGTDEASSAHVARLTATPVVLVVDASGASRSVAALARGFADFDPAVRVAGVLLNRVGSARHEAVLREALAGAGVAVFGALPRDPALTTPSRHLGLVPAPERAREAAAALDRLAHLVARHCDLAGLLAVARSAPPLAATPWSPGPARPVPGRPRVAVAAGPAFTFCYTETLELLAAAGAEVAPFDPLRDPALPEASRALVVGGGFPEEHAGALSANASLRADVHRLAAGGAPVHAECAGLLFLSRSLDGAPMCGVLPVSARMGERLVLGYRQATAADGRAVRAHEFHRTLASPDHGDPPAYTLAGGRPEGFRVGRVHASYLHPHWAGAPHLARDLVAAAVSG